MTDSEVTDVLTFFYPSSPPGSINTELRTVAAKMLHAALEASRAMDLVPRPTGVPSPSWLAQEAVRAAWRSRAARNKIYDSVRNATALKWRSEYELAKAGL